MVDALDKYDIHYIEAQDKKSRVAFFYDPRVIKLVDLLKMEHLDYLGRVIYIFKSQRQFVKNFDDYEKGEYNSNGDDGIFNYRRYLVSVYKEQNLGTLGNLRAAILERLVYDFKRPKYMDNAWIEPFVYLRTKKEQSKKSIDVAAWNQNIKRGECVECAVSDNSVMNKTKKEEVRELQNILYIISDKLSIHFVSFTMTEALKRSVGLRSNINLVGRDKLVSFLKP